MTEENITKLVDALVALLPYLTGAIIGAIGGVLGTRYAKSLDRQATANEILRNKLEELVTEAKGLSTWLHEYRLYRLLEDHPKPELHQMKRIHTLVALYFPELMPLRDDQGEAARAYLETIDALSKAKKSRKTDAQKEKFAEAKRDSEKAKEEYFETAKKFVDKCAGKMSSLLS